jgi:hypothetical protein
MKLGTVPLIDALQDELVKLSPCNDLSLPE